MGDKAFFVIIAGINIVMWFIAICHMRFIGSRCEQIRKEHLELQKKETEYFHKIHESINEMTKMNISAMGTFISQISAIILNGENEGNISGETENRERKS